MKNFNDRLLADRSCGRWRQGVLCVIQSLPHPDFGCVTRFAEWFCVRPSFLFSPSPLPHRKAWYSGYDRSGSRIFLRRGGPLRNDHFNYHFYSIYQKFFNLVSCFTSTPINHNVSFCRIPVVLESHGSSLMRGRGGGGEGGECTTPVPSP